MTEKHQNPFKHGHNHSDNYPQPTEVLRKGTKNDQVKWLQTALNKTMNARLDIDGSYGPKTTEAVKEFQKKHGLTVDGVFGPKSREKMFQLLGCTCNCK